MTGLRSVNKESKIEVFGVVDLDYQYTFALKVLFSGFHKCFDFRVTIVLRAGGNYHSYF